MNLKKPSDWDLLIKWKIQTLIYMTAIISSIGLSAPDLKNKLKEKGYTLNEISKFMAKAKEPRHAPVQLGNGNGLLLFRNAQFHVI